AAPADGRRRRPALLRRPHARSRHARGAPRRPLDRPDPDRVPAARAVPPQPAAGAHPRRDLRSRLGLRLRTDLELARGVRRLPPPQDRGGRRAAPDPHRARRRVRAARAAMSFRLRVTLLAAAAVAAAVAASAAVVYVVVRHQLLGEVDSRLTSRAHDFAQHPGPGFEVGYVQLGPRASLGGAPTYLQVIDSTGQGAAIELPGFDRAKELASSGGKPFYTDGIAEVGTARAHVRVYSAQIGDGFAIQVARGLAEVDHTLHRLGLYMLFIGLGGVGLAGGLGLAVAG